METFFLILAGLLFGGIGGYLFWSDWQFFKRAIRVPGIVVDYKSQQGSKSGKMYAPVVSFEFDGEKRQVTGSVYSSGKPKIGEQRMVGIDPYHIEKARVYATGTFVFYGLFLLVGLACMAGAVFQWLD